MFRRRKAPKDIVTPQYFTSLRQGEESILRRTLSRILQEKDESFEISAEDCAFKYRPVCNSGSDVKSFHSRHSPTSWSSNVAVTKEVVHL